VKHSGVHLLQRGTRATKTQKLLGSGVAFVFCILLLGLAGCSDPITRHNTLNLFFDGVPDLPPVEQLCQEHMGDKYKEFYDALAEEEALKKQKANSKNQVYGYKHRPFAEKKCKGCHDFTKPNRLITEKSELCFVCHKNFIKGNFVHGPVAVGDCLACHLPHESKNPALLQESRSEICGKCHREKRLAAQMHEQVIDHRMDCVDCHDPHSSGAQYFLK